MEEGRWGNTMAGLSGQGLRMERCLLNKEEVLLPEAFVDQVYIITNQEFKKNEWIFCESILKNYTFIIIILGIWYTRCICVESLFNKFLAIFLKF